MKPFFDALNAAMTPYDPYLIKRLAEELKLKASAELVKVGQYDRSDAIAGLIDNLSDFLAEFDEEMEQPDPRIGAGERMAASARED